MKTFKTLALTMILAAALSAGLMAAAAAQCSCHGCESPEAAPQRQTTPGKAGFGYGRCADCYCRAFEGQYNTCTNCGHHYDRHY